jgi:DNA polymerase-4
LYRINPEGLPVQRSVLFVDPPAFCATVERLVVPSLRHRPVAVAPPGAERATVLALSSEARLAGITRGMPVLKARKLCPDLVLLPPNPRLYARASRALHEILRIYAPIIEPRGYGHAFLDLTGTSRLFGPAVDVAERIRRESVARLGLPLTVGIAVNKLVSEAATRIGRVADGRRGGNCPTAPLPHCPAGNEASFLAPHLIEVLPDVPLDIRERLDEYQLERIGMVAHITESDLCAVFGVRGRQLKAQALGLDPRPVLPPAARAELRASHTFATDTNDLGVLHPLLRLLAESLGEKLRRRGLAARRLTVAVEYADYEHDRRAVALPAAALDFELWEAAKRALRLAMARRVTLRTVTVGVDRLIARVQLDLFCEAGGKRQEAGTRMSTPASSLLPPASDDRRLKLQETVDHIHRRWGTRAVTVGSPAHPSLRPAALP